MKEASCGVARDLMPLCAEGIASEESREWVEGHAAGCAACAQVYADMRAGTPGPVPQAQSDLTFGRALRQMLRTIRLKNVLLGFVVALVLTAVIGFGYDALCMQTRPISPERVEIAFSQLPEGLVVQTVTVEGGYRFTRYGPSGQWFGAQEEAGVYYIQFLKPIITLSSLIWSHPSYTSLNIKDGILYHHDHHDLFPGQVSEGLEITEIRVGAPDNYRTVYQKGDPIPLADEETQAYFSPW